MEAIKTFQTNIHASGGSAMVGGTAWAPTRRGTSDRTTRHRDLRLKYFHPVQLDQRSDLQRHQKTQKPHLRKGSRGGTCIRASSSLLRRSLEAWHRLHHHHYHYHPICVRLVVFPKPSCGSTQVFILPFVLHSYYHDDVDYLHV